jgi:hypothetical protein
MRCVRRAAEEEAACHCGEVSCGVGHAQRGWAGGRSTPLARRSTEKHGEARTLARA